MDGAARVLGGGERGVRRAPALLPTPLLGMLLAAQGDVWLRGLRGVKCARLNHDTRERCIFRCRYGEEMR
jgi:hypothetical protein